MLLSYFLPFGCFFAVAFSVKSTEDSVIVLSGSATPTDAPPTGTYSSYTSTITRSSTSSFDEGSLGTMTNSESVMGTANATNSTSSTSASRTILHGTNKLTSATAVNGTASRNASTIASSTSTSVQPTNTTPCNGYTEFCQRKYSNITMVCAHNSPFVKAGSAAANQDLSVTTQLNDGIRMLQAQAHIVNNTVFLCHTSCDLLNAGTMTTYLTTVNSWIRSHPYDVITILIGNADYKPVTEFVSAIQDSGIDQYAYIPPKEPMALADWPTLASMILTGKRVVFFIDYQGNQTQVPWILNEFPQMWETPFDPTNRNFPCDLQRPPGLSTADANERMYLMNHNLNQNVSILGLSLSVPNKPLLGQTNNVSGFGSLGLAANNCDIQWSRPPNFLNVDYYNNGSGTVFEVAAKWNNVSYTAKCCGLVTSGAQRMLDFVGSTSVSMTLFIVISAWVLL